MDKDVLITCDPGKSEFGLAKFVDGELTWALGVDSKRGDVPKNIPIWLHTGRVAYSTAIKQVHGDTNPRLVIEKMKTRRGRSDAHKALIHLSLMSGVLAAWWPGDVSMIEPGRWTGSHSKARHQQRTMDYLDGYKEQGVIDLAIKGSPSNTESEIVDAVGIGFYVTGRY